MSTFVYVRWVRGQSNVYIDIFQESLHIKIFIQGIKDRIVVFWVPQTNFHKTLQKKKYFKKIIFSEQKYVHIDFPGKRSHLQNVYVDKGWMVTQMSTSVYER